MSTSKKRTTGNSLEIIRTLKKFLKPFFQNDEVNVFEREPRLIQNIFDTKEQSLILNSLTSLSNNRLEMSELYCVRSQREELYFM